MSKNCTVKTCGASEMAALKRIYKSAVAAVDSKALILNAVHLNENTLHVNNKTYNLQRPCHVFGFGKAVLGMSVALEEILGDKIKSGIVSVPVGIFERFKGKPELIPTAKSRIRYIEGAKNNLPDEGAVRASLEIKQLSKTLGEKDFAIVLISGGGSALLPLPDGEITLEEKLHVIKALSSAGADIKEMNSVRKKLSAIKGGKLAELIYPAKGVSLILSDVVGDPLDFIASGPTVPNLDHPDLAKDILIKYKLFEDLPHTVKTALSKIGPKSATPIISDRFQHFDSVLVGTNEKATTEAAKCAEGLGYSTAVISNAIVGDVEGLSEFYAELVDVLIGLISNEDKRSLEVFVKKHRGSMGMQEDNVKTLYRLNYANAKGLCIIGGGEPTVVLKGKGLGGRNQQLALLFSEKVKHHNEKLHKILFLSCGTDGIDGPTDAAGAIGSSTLYENALANHLDPKAYIDNNDSYAFYSRFENGKYHVKVGHTGTNVMDIHVLLIAREEVSPT